MSVEDLARPEIRGLHTYETAFQLSGALRLHANEAPWPAATSADSLNRYPEMRPTELQSRLAERFGVLPENLLATRGSSEAIDLLIRTFCRAGRDDIAITPPTFAMYQVYADIQGARTVSCPLSAEQGFRFDTNSVLESCTPQTRLVFVCSPNNPSGNLVPRQDILDLIRARKDKSVIVVDEAYIEFSDSASMAGLVTEHDNLVVLRTLSKALALAGARCGAVIGNVTLLNVLNGVLPPYAIATPVIDCVMRALSSEEETASASRIQKIIAERERLAGQLVKKPLVQNVWPSQANFLLVKFDDLEIVRKRMQKANILIRDFNDGPDLENCARITVGLPDENERLLAALNE